MSNLLSRSFGKVMDAYTSVRYGAEAATSKMSFGETVDKDMSGNEVKVSVVLREKNPMMHS
jgi:hypothetical protein